MFKILRDTCISQLEDILDSDLMEECRTFIEVRRERRHLSTLERHISKFRRLCHEKPGGHSNLRHDAQRNISGNTCITIHVIKQQPLQQLQLQSQTPPGLP